jgi:hexulose-6-phosphate isomerase
MKKGVNQWAFGNREIKECFKLAKEAGFNGVELNFSESGEFSLESKKNEFKEIKKYAEDLNLELPSICTGLLWKYPLSTPDKNLRRKGETIVKKMIEIAKFIGADTVLVVPGVLDEKTPYDYAYRTSQEIIIKLASFAEKAKIYIGIENVWNKFLLSPLEFCKFIDEINNPYVGCYFDVGNVLVSGYPQHWIEILGKRIKKIHIKDFIIQIGNIQGFTYLFQGDVNWKEVKNSLKKIDYNDYLIAELSPYKTHPEKLLEDTSKSMEIIINLL